MSADRAQWPVIAGGAITIFGRSKDGSTWRDRTRQVAAQAIAEAGLAPRDIDALVVGTESDIVSLQVNPATVIASEAGVGEAAAMRVEGGGASGALAIRSGVLHVLSGVARRVLVVGFDDTASHLDKAGLNLVYSLSFDAEIEGFAGATAASLYALSMREHMEKHGTTEADMAAVVVKNRRNAMSNPHAHLPHRCTVADVLASPPVSTPYKRLDCSPLSDAAAAIVLSRPENLPARQRPRVRIVGAGCATDFPRLGDRPERHRFAAKSKAAAQAYRQAGVERPAAEIDVAEVYDAFSGAELQSIEALGLCDPGQAGPALTDGAFSHESRMPVNLSGGLLGQGSAPGATGIAQAVTVSRLLRGEYFPSLQPTNTPRRGLVDAHGGIATLCVAHVLEREDI